MIQQINVQYIYICKVYTLYVQGLKRELPGGPLWNYKAAALDKK